MAQKKKTTSSEAGVVVPEVLPAESEQTHDLEAARALDTAINEKIEKAGNALASAYLSLAESLSEMRRTKGYKYLDPSYKTWDEYLQSKKSFGRAYLFFLAKLGESNLDQLRSYLDLGMPASKFIEYAKTPVLPEKIPQLISTTWEEVKDRSVRETSKFLRDFVSEHADEFAKPKRTFSGKKPGRTKSPWQQKLQRQYDKLTPEEQKSYLTALREFVKSH